MVEVVNIHLGEVFKLFNMIWILIPNIVVLFLDHI